MMRPYPRSIMWCPKAWQALKVPVRFVSKMLFHSLSRTCSEGVRFVVPALLTKISTEPNFVVTASSNVCRLSRLVTSTACPNAFPPPRYVSSGVYGLFSHPIYLGFSLVCIGAAIAAGSASGSLCPFAPAGLTSSRVDLHSG